MALSWDLTAIADYKSVCFEDTGDGDQRLSVVTEALIWLTMFTGVGWGITDKNAGEFYARVVIWEKVIGPGITNADGTPYHITQDDVRKHIGLKTNVSMDTRAAFLKKIQREMDKLKRKFETGTTAKVAAREPVVQ